MTGLSAQQRGGRFALLLALTSFGACTQAPIPTTTNLPQDAYIWQRHWTNVLDSSVSSFRGLIRQWRVLAAEVHPDGTAVEVPVDFTALRSSGNPVTMVVRINGDISSRLHATTAQLVMHLAESWRQAGLSPAGIEIDYNCPTGRLQGYQSFLHALRLINQRGFPLAITTLT